MRGLLFIEGRFQRQQLVREPFQIDHVFFSHDALM